MCCKHTHAIAVAKIDFHRSVEGDFGPSAGNHGCFLVGTELMPRYNLAILHHKAINKTCKRFGIFEHNIHTLDSVVFICGKRVGRVINFCPSAQTACRAIKITGNHIRSVVSGISLAIERSKPCKRHIETIYGIGKRINTGNSLGSAHNIDFAGERLHFEFAIHGSHCIFVIATRLIEECSLGVGDKFTVHSLVVAIDTIAVSLLVAASAGVGSYEEVAGSVVLPVDAIVGIDVTFAGSIYSAVADTGEIDISTGYQFGCNDEFNTLFNLVRLGKFYHSHGVFLIFGNIIICFRHEFAILIDLKSGAIHLAILKKTEGIN